jgi:hypothetical protein
LGSSGIWSAYQWLNDSIARSGIVTGRRYIEAFVSVLTAHKILIASAVALFFGYAGWEWRHYVAGDATAWLRSTVSGIAAIGLAIYLRWVWVRRPTEPPRQ